MSPSYVPHITFYEEGPDERWLGEVGHETVPRIGDHVDLSPTAHGSWEVVYVNWLYPTTQSRAYISGDRGGIVIVICREGKPPFPHQLTDEEGPDGYIPRFFATQEDTP